MFTLVSGLAIHKDAICRLLCNGALALGLDPRVVSTHSLRAGGRSAMFNADFQSTKFSAVVDGCHPVGSSAPGALGAKSPALPTE